MFEEYLYPYSFACGGWSRMKRSLIVLLLAALFVFVGFLILFDQYSQIGVWFQVSDLHHETFALSSFALAVGILVGGALRK